jgi:hypothetical protein
VANAFISPFSTQTMHIESFDTQHHCYFSVKKTWRDLNPGLLVPEADAMSTAPLRQGIHIYLLCTYLFGTTAICRPRIRRPLIHHL